MRAALEVAPAMVCLRIAPSVGSAVRRLQLAHQPAERAPGADVHARIRTEGGHCNMVEVAQVEA